VSKGIDISIDRLIDIFNSDLWNGKNNQLYGRVFRNERFEDFNSRISPEIWISANKPAIELLKNDNFDSQCFFDVQPNEEIIGSDVHSATIWICFMVNLIEIYPLLTRQDAVEQVQRDVEQLIIDTDFEITGLIRGYLGFIGYDWGSESSQSRADMHPHYCFRFDTNLKYVNC